MKHLLGHVERLVKGVISPKADKNKAVEININGNRLAIRYFEHDPVSRDVKIYKNWEYDFSNPAEVESNVRELSYLLSAIFMEVEPDLDEKESGDQNNG